MIGKNKGITLIAFVITIIIIFILAGVSTFVIIREEGLLTRLIKSKEETINPHTDKEPITQTSSEVTPGIIVTGENKAYTKNGTAIIPKGFAIVPGLDDVSQGLVISDNETDTEEKGKLKKSLGNQFVWVPVTDMDKFVRQEGYYEGEPQSFLSKCREANEEGINQNVKESEETQEEAKAMYKSVRDNGGFYIGRYETSKGSEENAEVKKNKRVWTDIEWGYIIEDKKKENILKNSDTGAVSKSRDMYKDKNTYGVTSTLCYGVQWDAALRFIDPNYTGYAIDSSGKGNYKGRKIKTGTNNKYAVKNIYDMAGNACELTMESYNESSRVYRGGDYDTEKENSKPSSVRFVIPSNIPGISVGFRITLYV